MEKIATPPLTVDQYTQDMLAILVDTTARLTEEVEKQLPAEFFVAYDQLSLYSRTPWSTLYWTLQCQPAYPLLNRNALLLRATLEEVGTKLHDVAHTLANVPHHANHNL